MRRRTYLTLTGVAVMPGCKTDVSDLVSLPEPKDDHPATAIGHRAIGQRAIGGGHPTD